MKDLIQTDVLVLGTGIAGSISALLLADQGLKVCLVTRSEKLSDSNTALAQGGIVFRGQNDSPSLLVSDMQRAGANYNNLKSLSILAEEGPAIVEEVLMKRLGIEFDRNADGSLSLAKEASHSVSRVLHSVDATGKEISKGYVQQLKAHRNIQILTKHTAIDLLTPSHHSKDIQSIYARHACSGAYLLDQDTGTVLRCLAQKTILATGGMGQIYLRSTNPQGSRGDGLAMAYRTGARIINNEFIQFHPTTFFKKDVSGFLISEALRGAGARLVHEDGKPFMDKYDAKWKDLAPRDVVSRSIYREMIEKDVAHVYLDLKSYLSVGGIESKFPTTLGSCLRYGVDIRTDLIPIVPAAHYACGGVWVDEWAKTNVDGLYAVGEVSCTGVHGANRLASTSLLEGLVWAKRAASHIEKTIEKSELKEDNIPAWKAMGDHQADPVLIKQDMDSVKNIMWNYVGLIRTTDRLNRAFRELKNLESEIETFYQKTRLSDQLIGLRNAVKAALVVTTAAFKNKKSIGCHFRASVFLVCLLTGLMINMPKGHSETTVNTDLKRLSYFHPHKGSHQEWRMKLSLDAQTKWRSKVNALFKATLWGLFPREVSEWFDVPEFYVEYKTSALDLKLGRILKKWGTLEGHSPIQSIFPSYSLDPLHKNRNGLMGLYAGYHLKSRYGFEMLWSPIFLPDLGGIRYETNEQNHFYSKSRWSLPLYYKIKIGEASLPLDYTLHRPKISDVLLKNAMTLRVSKQWSSFQAALVASYFVQPQARLDADPKIYIKDESTIEGRVHLYPKFDHQKMLAVKTQWDLKPFKIFGESAYISKDFKNLFAIAYENIVLGLHTNKSLTPAPTGPVALLERPKNYWFSKVNFKPMARLSYRFTSESDFNANEFFMSHQASLSMLKNLDLQAGVDIIYGKENTYWGHFRQFDRLWLEAKYVF